MSSGFEEFYDKKSFVCHCGATKLVFSVKDLGEWAWKEAVGRGHLVAIVNDGFVNLAVLKEEFVVELLMGSLKSNPRAKQVFEIAVACLGKEEIKRRLKSLSEAKKKNG